MPELQPVPAATVVLLREALSGGTLEVLLLKRNSRLVFHGGHWVFPGGRIDEQDFETASNGELIEAARQAAVRETREEAGLKITTDSLLHTAHWTTPPSLPRRFSTWFFLCPLREQSAVTIDEAEIMDFCWISPEQALEAHDKEQMTLPMPTRTTLGDLVGFASVDHALEQARQREIRVFPPNSEFYDPQGDS